jgi:short-subunit dehydrogenase
VEQLPLTGRTALVTGASRGIGAATATALDRAGARVALVARSREGLTEIARGLEHQPIVLVADLSETGASASIAQQCLANLVQLTSW